MRAIDLKKAREDTPGCENVLHLNNAGASLPPRSVLDMQIEYLNAEAQNGGYETAELYADKLNGVYGKIAQMLNCQAEEVAIIENATRAWDMAFYSIPFKAGDKILTGMNEYASNYIGFLQIAQKTGAQVEVVPNDEHGQISIEALRKMIDKRVKLIAITHVPTNGGLVNPAEAVGKVAKEAGVWYLLDACQSVGQRLVDVEKIGCHFLSATGRKYLRAPRGTGFLYVNKAVIEQIEPVLLDLHAAVWETPTEFSIRNDARRFENWETNCAAKAGLYTAVDYALGWGLDNIQERVTKLAASFREQLEAIKGVTVQDIGQEKSGIVTFTVEGKKADDLKAYLRQHQINTSVTRRGSTMLDMDNRNITEMSRASVHYYNSETELERFCETIERMKDEG
jgi:cysteine desulfurase / selenocysteine lyase